MCPLRTLTNKAQNLIWSMKHSTALMIFAAADSRLHFLLGTEAADDVTKALEAVREGLLSRRLIDRTPYLTLEPSEYADIALMAKIGSALQLPSELLALARSAAVYAKSQAEDFERRIKEMGTKAQQSI